MYMEDEILDYIKLVREAVPNSVEVFTKGNCGAFARMLLKTFHGGEIVDYLGHMVYEYRGNWYDITGNIEGKDIEFEKGLPIIAHGLDKAIRLLENSYGK